MSKRCILAVAMGAAAFLGLAPAAVSKNTPERSVRLLVKIREPLAGEIEAALPLATMYLVAGQCRIRMERPRGVIR